MDRLTLFELFPRGEDFGRIVWVDRWCQVRSLYRITVPLWCFFCFGFLHKFYSGNDEGVLAVGAVGASWWDTRIRHLRVERCWTATPCHMGTILC